MIDNKKNIKTEYSELESQLIRATYGVPLLSPFLNILVAVVTASLFIDEVVMLNLLLWVSLVAITSLIRIASLLMFRRIHPSSPIDKKWGLMAITFMGLNASSWGASSILLFVPDSFQMQMTLAAFVSVTAIFVTMSISYIPAVVAFVVLSMPPIVIMLLIQNTPDHYATAAVVLILIISTPMVALKRSRIMKELIGLRMDLVREKESAEQANIAKSKFLAAASHDLRQPLHALSIFTGTLRTRSTNKEDLEIIDSISSSVIALENLLNALLDISRLDAGAVTPRKKDFMLNDIVKQLRTEFSSQAESNNITLMIESCDMAVHSDPILLETILRNLVSNALRYTQVGSVTLHIRKEKEIVYIEVTDTGIGIPAAQHEAIFKEFYQVHNTERDRSKGLGLGLAIVWRLVQLLGNDLTLNSILNKGSKFTLSLPLSKCTVSLNDSPTHDSQSNIVLPSIHVLVIDDEESIRRGTRLLLESWGIDVSTAESSKKAIEQIIKTGKKPNAIMADFRLRNDKTGIQAIEEIRNQTEVEIPAILITGDIAQEQLKEIKASKFTVLYKPVAPARIRAFIRQIQRQLLESSP